MSIEGEMLRVIERDLPNQIGSVLKTRLEQADKDAQELAQARLEIQQCKDKLLAQSRLLTEHGLLETRARNLAAKETELAARERELALELVKEQLRSAQTNAQFARDVAMGLVRNTEYRDTVFKTEQVPMPSGSYAHTASSTDTHTKSAT